MAVYLDHNATTPLPAGVRAAINRELADPPANPSSLHGPGQRARERIEQARVELAEAVAAEPAQVVFCGSGSEANLLALAGVVWGTRRGKIVVSALEHPSLLLAAQSLCKRAGKQLVELPATPDGFVDAAAAGRLIDDDVALVSLMWANHETGALQPLEAVAELARHHGSLMHVDAAQALGRVPVALEGLDMLSLSGHKLGALQGVGALVLRPGVPLVPLVEKSHHERGLRAGTENVLGILSLGAACRTQLQRSLEAMPRLQSLRDSLAERIAERIEGVQRLTPRGPGALAQTLLLHIEGAHGEALVEELSQREVAASTGAACAAGRSDPSTVLLAMGLSPADALCALRLSMGPETSVVDTDQALEALVAAVAAVREHAGGGAAG